MKAATVRVWSEIHTWSSLICTVFLLMLCLTGLPLIFHEEIEALTHPRAPSHAVAGPAPDLDALVQAARATKPELVPQFISWDPDNPAEIGVFLAPTVDATTGGQGVIIDAQSARPVGERLPEGFMHIMLELHTDLFVGLPGALFLGLMGILFVAAIVSGVVLYSPFMRRLSFGTLRKDRTTRLLWLDVHNLVGVVTVGWVIVVGVTGVINTWAELALKFWQVDELAAMTAPYKGQPAPDRLGPVQPTVEVARAALPGMTPAFIAWPGTGFSSTHHYAVFMRGDTPLTSRLLQPVLVDAVSGKLTDTRPLPWYLTTILVSQPLHFGDYGGLPLKVIWAAFDLATIAVLGSGVYLWARRRKFRQSRLAPSVAAAAGAPARYQSSGVAGPGVGRTGGVAAPGVVQTGGVEGA